MTETGSQDPEAVRTAVRAGYAGIARGEGERCGGTSTCCAGNSRLTEHIGYAGADLAALPADADMGLSCGNPTALADLKAGEVVLDLGSGGGLDCFIAGPRVGATGRVIGVDMTADMVGRARRNIAEYRQRSGLDNVEFRLGEIEHLPVADASVDVVISNCVLNLSPDKPQVWREIARVLRPGGRVAVSDLALLRPLPEEVSGMIEALVGCIAGAVLMEETRRFAVQAGLEDVALTPRPDYVRAMTGFHDPLYQRILAALPPGLEVADLVTSLYVEARKPLRPKPGNAAAQQSGVRL